MFPLWAERRCSRETTSSSAARRRTRRRRRRRRRDLGRWRRDVACARPERRELDVRVGAIGRGHRSDQEPRRGRQRKHRDTAGWDQRHRRREDVPVQHLGAGDDSAAGASDDLNADRGRREVPRRCGRQHHGPAVLQARGEHRHAHRSPVVQHRNVAGHRDLQQRDRNRLGLATRQLSRLPVAISANTTYVASYHTSSGGYAGTAGYFSTSGHHNAPLHALQNGVDGPNGVFRYGASAFSDGHLRTPRTTGSTWCSRRRWLNFPPTAAQRQLQRRAERHPHRDGSRACSRTIRNPIRARRCRRFSSRRPSHGSLTLDPTAVSSTPRSPVSAGPIPSPTGRTTEQVSSNLATVTIAVNDCPCTIWDETAIPQFTERRGSDAARARREVPVAGERLHHRPALLQRPGERRAAHRAPVDEHRRPAGRGRPSRTRPPRVGSGSPSLRR